MKLEYKLSTRRNSFGEFVIRAYMNGKRYKGADYHTTDWDDAEATLVSLRLGPILYQDKAFDVFKGDIAFEMVKEEEEDVRPF